MPKQRTQQDDGHERERGKRGEGSIVQVREGVWRVFVPLGTDPLSKRRRRISKTVYGTWEDAVAERERLKLQAQRRELGTAPAKMTVAEYMEEWLRTGKVLGWSPTTYSRYESIVRLQIQPALGGIRLRQLERRHIERWVVSLKEAGYSTKTIKNMKGVLSAALSHAVENGLIPHNPAANIRLRESQPKEPKAIADRDLEAFLAAARRSKYYLPIRLAAATGLRRGEVLGLRWRDVDLDEGCVEVHQIVVEAKTDTGKWEPIIKPAPKTASAVRRVYIDDPELIALLRRHRRQQLEQRLKAGPAWQDHDLVFCREDGRPMRPTCMSNLTKHFARAVGREGAIHLHALRHTHASVLLTLGWPLPEVSRRLGHSTPAVTAEVYSHALPDRQRELVRKLGTRLARGGGSPGHPPEAR